MEADSNLLADRATKRVIAKITHRNLAFVERNCYKLNTFRNSKYVPSFLEMMLHCFRGDPQSSRDRVHREASADEHRALQLAITQARLLGSEISVARFEQQSSGRLESGASKPMCHRKIFAGKGSAIPHAEVGRP
jgi:hypothetical protein